MNLPPDPDAAGRPACKTCPFWVLVDEEFHEITLDRFRELYGEGNDEIGECKRFPPRMDRVVHRVGPDGWGHGSHSAVQRIVARDTETYADDWCGEHPDFPAYIARLRSTEGA